MKPWDKIKQFVGMTEEQESEKKWRPEALPDTPRPRRRGRGWRRFGFPRLALGPGRRAARLEFIRQSQLQGIAIAAKRHEAMTKDRAEGDHFFMTAFRRSQRRV